MKRAFTFFLFFILLIVGLFFYNHKSKKNSSKITPEKIISPTTKINKKEFVSEDLFIPYWTFNESFVLDNNYNRVIFFDPDFSHVGQFVDQTKNFTYKKDITVKVNEYEQMTPELIENSITIVKKNNLNGLVFDLEIPMVLTEENKGQINDFVELFYTAAKQNYKSFSIAMYGDLFYRKRGYDLSFINKHSDEILIMAYDFHKASGEPGPNFQFGGIEEYNYDFKTMVEDYLKYVPADKLNVIFGMYGYDWSVDEQKRPLESARALTLNEIRKEFLEKCQWKDCLINRDEQAKETEVNYVVPYQLEDDLMGEELHIVWFEDEESVKIKTEFLKEKGIGKISYWGYGYF
jgi:spore germination protein YaaH